MYVEAIEKLRKFVRPIFSISRNYGSKIVQPGGATLFFINKEGWAITCAHVADQLIVAEQIQKMYPAIKKELAKIKNQKGSRQLRRKMEKWHNLNSNTTVELKNSFVDCVKGQLKLKIIKHSFADLALIKFEDLMDYFAPNFLSLVRAGSS